MKTKKLTLAVIVCVAVAFTSCSISVKDNPKDSPKTEEQTTSQEPENQTPSPEPDPAPTPTPVLSPEEIPLTLEAIDAGTITITNPSEFTNLKYSLNDGEKILVQTTELTATIQYNAKDIICFFADGPANEDYTYLKINCSGDCYIYGNVMSLSAESNYGDKTTIPGPYYFIGLFEGNDHITIHPEEPLILPATLSVGCYYKMFKECSGLSTAQNLDLKATTLTKNCYKQMFYRRYKYDCRNYI